MMDRLSSDAAARYEHLVWLDADAVVLDMGRKLHELLAQYPQEVVCAEDCSAASLINTGVLALRPSDYVRRLCEDALLFPQHARVLLCYGSRFCKPPLPRRCTRLQTHSLCPLRRTGPDGVVSLDGVLSSAHPCKDQGLRPRPGCCPKTDSLQLLGCTGSVHEGQLVGRIGDRLDLLMSVEFLCCTLQMCLLGPPVKFCHLS